MASILSRPQCVMHMFCCAQFVISHTLCTRFVALSLWYLIHYAHVLLRSVYDISYIMHMFCCAQFMISHTLCTCFVALSLWYLIHYAHVLLRSVYDVPIHILLCLVLWWLYDEFPMDSCNLFTHIIKVLFQRYWENLKTVPLTAK